MTSLYFFGGVNEIGGNKILVEDRGTKVFLDFGKSFGTWGKFFEEFLRPAPSRGIEQFWQTGLLPDLKGVYRPDLLEFAGAPVHKEPSVHAVFLSHAHQDHASYISFLDNRIPVYCSPVTKVVLEAVEAVGTRGLEGEVTDFKPRPLLRKDYRKPPIKRDIRTVQRKVKLDSIEVEFLPVDHSIPGACAMLMHCSDCTIAYSGDLRLHGTFGNMTQEFAEKAALEKPDVFLCEGTRIDSTSDHGEPYVKANASKVIEESKGLVTVDFSWKDTTRFLTLYGIAKDSGRKLLIPFRLAHYIQALKPTFPALPDLKDENLLLFQEKAGSGTYDDADHVQWQREFLRFPNVMRSEQVRERQSEIIACLGYFDMLDLLDIQPKEGSAYIHSLSEPYSEEMEFDAKRCASWLELLKLPHHQIHASGHAPKQYLFRVAETVAAKKLVPIHTEHPEVYLETGLKLELAEIGKEIKV